MAIAACARSAASTALLIALLGAACIAESVGYVEIKVFPNLGIPLYLNSVKLEPLKNGAGVLRQKVGKAKLETERDGQLAALCTFDVSKNRIITVTVSTLDRRPRCDVQK